MNSLPLAHDNRRGAPLPEIVIPAPYYAVQPQFILGTNGDDLSPILETTTTRMLRPREKTPHMSRNRFIPSNSGNVILADQITLGPSGPSANVSTRDTEDMARLLELFEATSSRALKVRD